MVHSLSDGQYQDLFLSERVKPMIVEKNIYGKHGQTVYQYRGSNHILGMMILQYPSQAIMLDMVDNMEKDIRVITQ